MKSYEQFLNENLFSSVKSFLKKLFVIPKSDKTATVEVKDEIDEEEIERQKDRQFHKDFIASLTDITNQNIEVNNNLQKMADDISLDFSRNPSAYKINVYNEPPNTAFYYKFDDGRKIKLSFMPGGQGGILIYPLKDGGVITFTLNATTVNNWTNEFSKLRAFAR